MPSPFPLNPAPASPAAWSAVKKNKLDLTPGLRQHNRMAQSPFRFVRDLPALSEHLWSLKQLCCQFCGAVETLNRHSKLYGNDPDSTQGPPRQRGQRVWCCDRGQRGGCGRTFSIFLADVLPRHTVSASALGRLLERLLGGGSLKAAAEASGLPFALESLYHLLHRVRERLAQVRSALCRERQAPQSGQTDPLLQTMEHLQSRFPDSACAVVDFQLHFQRPLLE